MPKRAAALHDALLEAARHLAIVQTGHAAGGFRRRAISTAYYALFHFLISESVRVVMPRVEPPLKRWIVRAYSHSDLRAVCQQFANGRIENVRQPAQGLLAAPIAPELTKIAIGFVELQAMRELADYDLSYDASSAEADLAVFLAEDAMRAWKRLGAGQNQTVFLTALLLNRQWARTSP
ncbi:MAG: hypothetical protein FJX46_11090 [Alphaproteobacteria bacterium]|nr:hypothetical protein [Alphaproteobacteria bacterium]